MPNIILTAVTLACLLRQTGALVVSTAHRGCFDDMANWKARVPSLNGAASAKILLALDSGTPNKMWFHAIDGKDAAFGRDAYSTETSRPANQTSVNSQYVDDVSNAYRRLAQMLGPTRHREAT